MVSQSCHGLHRCHDCGSSSKAKESFVLAIFEFKLRGHRVIAEARTLFKKANGVRSETRQRKDYAFTLDALWVCAG